MEAIFQWVKSLAYYLILVSLLSNLIPNGKYDRYIRLFTGAVFILLLIRPLSGSLNLEGKLAYAYEKIRLQQDTGEFSSRLWGMEEERTRQIIRQYEEAAAQEVKRMALEEGLLCREAQVMIEGDSDSEKFGQVKELSLVLERGESNGGMAGDADGAGWTENAGTKAGELSGTESKRKNETEYEETETAGGSASVKSVEPVQIQVETAEEDAENSAGDLPEGNFRGNTLREADSLGNSGTEQGTEQGTQSREERLIRQKEQEALYGFQRKLAVYYGLEEENIRITWQDEPG